MPLTYAPLPADGERSAVVVIDAKKRYAYDR